MAEAQLAGGDVASARATIAEAAKIRDQIQNPAERGALDGIAKRL
jgi:hypothetical protein